MSVRVGNMRLGTTDFAAVIILAGGTGRRLGGVSKPDYRVAGQRLIDILFAELEAAGFAGRCVVVGPPNLDVRPGVRLVLEDPPLGGPLAGIAAGVAALSDFDDDDLVLLATCDAPLSVRLLPDLLAELANARGNGVSEGRSTSEENAVVGAVPIKDDGEAWPQYLQGLYLLEGLRRVPNERHGAIRFGFGGLETVAVRDVMNHCLDVDTEDDAARLADRL